MTERQFIRALRREVKAFGGVRAFARSHRISPASVSNVLASKQRAGQDVASTLGLIAARTIIWTYRHALIDSEFKGR